MSLELLLESTLPKALQDNKLVSPTLLIGLGGTGKEVLLRLRRLVVERYGSLSNLPFVQYLHLDTDATAASREQYDLRQQDDPLYSKVRLSPAERVDLSIEGGTAKYVDNINTYPHIKRWFRPEGKIAKLGNLGEGAGQIRMASRLGFYHDSNFRGLSSHLERAQAALKDAANLSRAAESGFDLDPGRINVYVIASLAGGTGSGVFLDMGYLLQKYFPSDDRVAILLLPNFFGGYAGGEKRMRANGYAALMELNHYSFGNHFYANWDGRNVDLLPPPPFSTTYLIDSRNEAGISIGSSGKEYDAYRMCAEVLYQDFSIGSFAGMKRATRVNLVNFTLNAYTHNFLNEALGQKGTALEKAVVGDVFPTRFSSFGLSSIHFPTNRVHNACASRLAREILEFWKRSQLEDPFEKLFTSFLSHPDVQFVQGRYERRDGAGIIEGMQVEDALLKYDRASSRSFSSHIWDKARNLRLEVESATKGQKAAVLRAGLELMEKELAAEDAANPEEWGSWLRTIEENYRLYLEDVKRGIENQVKTYVNDPRLGVYHALSLLQALKEVLRHANYQYIPHFESTYGSWADEAQRQGDRVRGIMTAVSRYEQRWFASRHDVAQEISDLVADDLDAEDLGALYNYLFARVMKQVVRRGLKICEAVDELLGKNDATGKGLIGRYYQGLVQLTQLQGRLEKQERYFETQEHSELKLSLYRQGDTERWYEAWTGSQELRPEILRQVGNQMLAEVFKVDTVTAALDRVAKMPMDQVEERLLAHCKRFFEGQNLQPDALELLLDSERLSTTDREKVISDAYRLAKVWVQRPERGIDHVPLRAVTSDQRPCLIGLFDGEARLAQEFKDILAQKILAPGDSLPSFRSLGGTNRGAIVFYNEVGGIPAFYPSSVMSPAGLKESYEGHDDKEELHIDRNRFQFGDLIPKRNDEAGWYADALRAFVLGRVLGVIAVSEKAVQGSEQPALTYSFIRRDGHRATQVALGEEANAIDRLYRDRRAEHETDRRQLLNEIESLLSTLARMHLLEVYDLLLEFYIEVVYPPGKDRVEELGVTLVEYAPPYAVLDAARSQLTTLLSDRDAQARFAEALRSLRGKPPEQSLRYDEFKTALQAHTRPAGKVVVTTKGATGTPRNTLLEVLALDRSKVEGPPQAERPRPAGTKPSSAAPLSDLPMRSCSVCSTEIPAPALFCRYCKTQLAQSHETCPHCQETKVPDDLDNCWRCGKPMPGKGERVTCPRCYSFTGRQDEFPCPTCGYNFNEATTPVPEETAEARATPAAEAGFKSAAPEPSIPSPARTPEAPELVQCPNCWMNVPAGPQCAECGSPLQ